jgi:hypothetical protein
VAHKKSGPKRRFLNQNGLVTLNIIPKLTNTDSSFPTSCWACTSKNANRIKHLNGREKPGTTPRIGRDQRQLV